jgi:hypothetical protein
MIRALRFLASATREERAEAYGHGAWAMALVAAFVVLFAAVTPS